MATKAAEPVVEVALAPKDETPAALPATVSSQAAVVAAGDPYISMIERVLLDPMIDIGKLERLEQMYERAQTRVAEQAFNNAMAAAQAEMKAVAPDLHNKQTHSDYASYAAMDRMARPIYTKHGLALSFNSEESKVADHIGVICYATGHGFTRIYRVDMPADGKGAKGGDVMTKTHAAGSAFSYAQRYLLKLIFNIAVGDDDDGNAAGKKQEREIVAPEGFENWYDDMDALVLGGCTWKEFATAWNPDGIAKFREHLAKTNPGKIDEWKRKAKAQKESR